MPRASEMSGERETLLSPMEETGGAGKPTNGNGLRHDGCVTDGSNLDHVMCEICAAKFERAKASPVSAVAPW
jgi:hypothetical protein